MSTEEWGGDTASPVTEPRQHYAVWLTLKEAQYLNRRASNVGTRPCCPHLDVFHNSGRKLNGGEWTSCNLCDCIHERERPSCCGCWACGYDERRDKQAVKAAMWGVAAAVFPLGLLIGWWLS